MIRKNHRGLVTSTAAVKKRSLQNKLRANGVCTTATICVTVIKHISARSYIPDRESYELTYSWDVPALDITCRGNVRMKDDPRLRLFICEHELPVYFDPNNPQRHFLDLSAWEK